MFRVLAWKEFREQLPVFVAVVLLAILIVVVEVLASTPTTNWESKESTKALSITLIIALGALYGLVSGSMTLAGEREGGTQPWLDTLAGTRRRVWNIKLCTALAANILLWILLIAAMLFGPGTIPVKDFDAFLMVWLSIFAVAMCCSSWSSSTLVACACGVPLTIAGWIAGIFATTFILWLISFAITLDQSPAAYWRSPGLLLTLAALGISRTIYCRPDWSRQDVAQKRIGTRLANTIPQTRTALWLIVRQGRMALPLLVLGAPAVALLLDWWAHQAYRPLDAESRELFGNFFLVRQPLSALLVGVICGVAAFTDEQTQFGGRLWGDLRLPIRRLWAWKVAVWLLAAFVAQWLIWIVDQQIFLRISVSGSHELPLFWRWGGALYSFSWCLAWLTTGFAMASLLVLLARKTIVALVWALILALPFLAIWIPSVMTLPELDWRPFCGVPCALLLGSLWLTTLWVRGQATTRRGVAIVVSAVTASIAWTGLALWQRATEIPFVPSPWSTAAILAKVPRGDKNSGQELIAAMRELKIALCATNESHANANDRLAMDLVHWFRAGEWYAKLLERLTQEWPQSAGTFGERLDAIFAVADWQQTLARFAERPPGVLRDPDQRRLDEIDPFERVWIDEKPRSEHVPSNDACDLARLLILRARQQTSRGDLAAAMRALREALAVTRTARHFSPSWQLWIDLTEIDWQIVAAYEGWLAKAGTQVELLQTALADVTRHEQELPAAKESFEARYIASSQALTSDEPVGFGDSHSRPPAFIQAIAWGTPWESERRRRAQNLIANYWDELSAETYYGEHEQTEYGPRWIGVLPWTTRAARQTRVSGEPLRKPMWQTPWIVNQYFWIVPRPTPAALDAATVCPIRALRLELALALYRQAHGELPPTLDELAPALLEKLPLDPYSGQSFGYRVVNKAMWLNEVVIGHQSKQGSPKLQRIGPEESAMVWSVGPDLIDASGKLKGNLPGLSMTVYFGVQFSERFDLVYVLHPVAHEADKPTP